MSPKEQAQELKANLLNRIPKPVIGPRQMLQTGSTLLNLACSENANGGFPLEKYILLVGDTDSGKTFLTWSSLAEAAIRSDRFGRHRFIVDDPEDGAMMDKAALFGDRIIERVEPPRGTIKNPVWSRTAQEFYDHIDDAFKAKKPFIYILDSENALSTEQDAAKHSAQKAQRRGGKEVVGSMQMAKPKEHSNRINVVRSALKGTQSLLIVISQSRDNIGGYGADKTMSGGWALQFYADMQIWTSVAGTLTKTYKGKTIQQGNKIRIKTKRNRLTGKRREVVVPIYNTYGIDDVGSMIDWLVEWKYWADSGEKDSKTIIAEEFSFEGKRDKLIKQIEDENREQELKVIVQRHWNAIEEATAVRRKPRY